MNELYNDNNIKVYVDDNRYEIKDVNRKYVTVSDINQRDTTTLRITLDTFFITDCTITIKGKTVTIDGTSNHSKMALYVESNGYHLKLKGNLVIRVYNGNEEEPVTTTLYDEAQVLQYTFSGRYNKVDYILHDKSLLIRTGSAGQGPLKVYLYDNSICTLNNGEAKIHAYDNSKVEAGPLVTELEVDAYDNAKVEVDEGVDIIINDESKLTIV